MSGLVRAEWWKLTTVRTAGWLALALVGLMLLASLLPLLVSPPGVPGPPQVDDPALQLSVLFSGAQAATFALILGIIGAAGEYRQGLITPTLLVTPVRGQMVAGKVIVYAVAGFLLGVIALAVAALAVLVVAGPGDLGIPAADWARVVLGSLAFATLSGPLGVGLGFLIRSQVGALAVALVAILVVEPLVSAFLPDVGPWLMGTAGQALAGVELVRGGQPPGVQSLPYLSQGVGGLVVAGYAGVLALLGYWRLRTQDIG